MNGPQRLKWSNFFITINAHRQADTTEMVEATYALAEPEHLWTWLKRYDGGAKRDFRGAEKSLVERVRMRVSLEQGNGPSELPHVHIVAEIAHRTMVQVDFHGIKDTFREYVGGNPNVNCKYLRGDADVQHVLRYITKEIPNRASGHRTLDRVAGNFQSGNPNVYDISRTVN